MEKKKKKKVEAHQTQALLYLSWITERRECVKIGQLRQGGETVVDEIE